MKINSQHTFLFIFALLVVFLYQPELGAEEFIYKFKKGDRYRIISTVHEDVFIDRQLSHRAEILNRIAVEVTSVKGNRGTHRVVFQTSERAAGVAAEQDRSFQWSREYNSEFDRDHLGYLNIGRQYFMPVVRNVPVFPGKDLQQDDRWSADGHEMHDFRDSFGIPNPYRIPFTANYVFLGNREWKGQTYPAFSVSYNIFTEPRAVSGQIWPRRITGSSDQVVFWNRELGQPAAYEERFRMVFDLSNGVTIEYRGTAEAELIESNHMDKTRLIDEINDAINRLGIQDATVRAADEGITISLDNIQFEADTARMLPSEQEKLNKIAGILAQYPERDILVGGHTALAGSPEGRQQLSAERAAIVADHLIARKARSPDRVVVRGYGADRPLADNRTEEGRRKNRRVEITILEN